MKPIEAWDIISANPECFHDLNKLLAMVEEEKND